MQIGADLVEPDFFQTVGDVGQLRLQLLHIGALHRREWHWQRVIAAAEHRRLGHPFDVHVELSGDQVAGLELGAIAVLDQVTDEGTILLLGRLAGSTGFFHQVQEGIAHLARIQQGIHPDKEILALLIEVQTGFKHLADRHAAQLDRRPDGQPAHGLVIAHAHDHRRFGAARHGHLGVVMQLETCAFRCRIGHGLGDLLGRHRHSGFRRLAKGHATSHDGGQRFGVDLDPIRSDRYINPGSIPETGTWRHVGVVGLVDENLHPDALAILGQRIGRDTPHLHAPVEHGGTDAERSQRVGHQVVALALAVARDGRRLLQADKLGLLGIGIVARIGPDIGA